MVKIGWMVAWTWSVLATSVWAADENLLRDDFVPDGVGGFLGWSGAGFGGAFVPERIDGPGGAPALRLFSNAPDDRAEVMYSPSGAFAIDTNEIVRFSAKVRTQGLADAPSNFRIYPEPWSHDLIVRIPADTKGEWVEVSWEGKIPFCERRGLFYLTVFTSKPYPKGAYLDFAQPKLTATLRRDIPSRLPKDVKAGDLKPRVTPVDPVLDELAADAARMRFYYPGPLTDGGARCFLRATLGEKTVEAAFDADHFATADFGEQTPGKRPLTAEVVAEGTGRVVVRSVYRAQVRARVAQPTPLKRLNNFVSVIGEGAVSEKPFAFTLARRSWVYVGLDRAGTDVEATIDGKPVLKTPAVARLEMPEDLPEAMRELEAGTHVLAFAGTADAPGVNYTLRVVPTIIRTALDKAARMSKNFAVYYYGPDFYRELGLFRGFNYTSFDWGMGQGKAGRPLVADLRERGISVAYNYGMGARAPMRLDFPAYLTFVTNQPSYRAGADGQFDENSIAAPIGGLAKANATEVWWRAYDEGRCIKVFFEDGAHCLHANPVLDIPELSAYVNSGDGRGQMISEIYFSSPESEADVARVISFMKRQIAAMRALVPSAPAHYVYLLNGWMMIGGWTTWFNPANDIRALNGAILRTLATDPAFADIGGAAISSPACPDDLYRFYAEAIRYYCIEGGTDDFAALNGMRLFPGHVSNGDFADGFAGWTPVAAAPGSLVVASRPKVGEKWQGRGYARWTKPKNGLRLGDTYAVFTRAATAPNTLRQPLVGLEPGRVYQLTFVYSDVETMERTLSAGVSRRNVKPVRLPHLAARVDGAEPIRDLDHLQPDFGKYGKNLVFATRLVFRATAPTAEVVFSDWQDASTPGTDVGAKVMLNYVGCHPYFNRSAGDIEKLKKFFKQAKELK